MFTEILKSQTTKRIYEIISIECDAKKKNRKKWIKWTVFI